MAEAADAASAASVSARTPGPGPLDDRLRMRGAALPGSIRSHPLRAPGGALAPGSRVAGRHFAGNPGVGGQRRPRAAVTFTATTYGDGKRRSGSGDREGWRETPLLDANGVATHVIPDRDRPLPRTSGDRGLDTVMVHVRQPVSRVEVTAHYPVLFGPRRADPDSWRHGVAASGTRLKRGAKPRRTRECAGARARKGAAGRRKQFDGEFTPLLGRVPPGAADGERRATGGD
jgi:hypothetical protein